MLSLTKEQAQQIIDLHHAGEKPKNLAQRFGVSSACVLHILKGKTWKECIRPDNLNLIIGKINQEQAQEIINLFVEGMDLKFLSDKFKISERNIRNIIKGETWKECIRPNNIENRFKKTIYQELAQKIIDEFCAGFSTYELEEKYNLWQTSICNIIAGRSWEQCKRPDNIKKLIEERKQIGRFKLGDIHHIEASPFTEKQEDIIIGSLLGDGSISNGLKNYSFSKSQRKDRLKYLEWMYEELQPYSSKIYPIYSKEKLIGGKNGVILKRIEIPKYLSAYAFCTHQHPNWTNLRNKWYKKTKIVPNDLTLNPLRIATWFWDDGSNSYKNRSAIFCTQSFTMEEADFLASKLHNFEIYPSLIFTTSTYTGKKMPILNICSKSYDNLIELIKPYMLWDCFAHKIKHREALNNYTRKPINEWKNDPRKLNEKQVLEILELSNSFSQQKIAEMFDVSQTNISAIITGKTWKFVKK